KILERLAHCRSSLSVLIQICHRPRLRLRASRAAITVVDVISRFACCCEHQLTAAFDIFVYPT
ncbi:MAG: hypothetical protein WBB34_14495, partial [Xanthobacteraceae bacterium]